MDWATAQRRKTLAIHNPSASSPKSWANPKGNFFNSHCSSPLVTKQELLSLPLHISSRNKTKMKVIAAYLLAVLGGNTNPSADDLRKILGSVGVDGDGDRIDFLLAEVKGKDVTELIASGREKLASVPSGGGGVAVAAASGGAAGGGAAAPAAEAKKEEKVEEKEESDDDMGFSLFD